MVYHYPICNCGKSLFPTDEFVQFESGTGHIYKCENGHIVPIQESIFC